MPQTKVISLLPRTNTGFSRRVSRAISFAPPGTVFRPEVTLSAGVITCTHEALWNARVPVDPALALEILTRDLPPPDRIEMSLLPGSGYIDVTITALDYEDNRCFNMSNERAGWGNIKVPEDKQHLGIGRRLMRNEIEFAHAVGIKTFKILAGSKAGGYVWRAMGVTPVNMNSQSFDQDTRLRAVGKYETIRLLLSTDEQRIVTPLLELRNDRQMQALVELDMNLSPRLNQVFNQATVYSPDRHKTMIALAANFSERAREGKKITVGQVLLAGTCWEGQLDLQDPVQMQRVGQYVGGWKYIGFQ